MITLSIDEILKSVNGKLVSNSKNNVIFNFINTDSRKIKGGNELFVALIGNKFDGHNFVLDSLKNGASGALVNEKWFLEHKDLLTIKDKIIIVVEDTLKALGDIANLWRNKNKIKIIVITGSTGKTTTKEITFSIIKNKYSAIKTEGNLNNLIGVPQTLFNIKETDEFAVIEIGMNKFGEIRRLTQITNPNFGLITNISYAHLKGVGDINGVAKAKGELFEEMDESSFFIINNDDPYIKKMKYGKNYISFGIENKSDIMAKNIKDLGLNGSNFTLYLKDEKIDIHLNLIGTHNIYNVLGASAIAYALNIPYNLIKEGIEELKLVNQRAEIIRLKNITIINDSYNANPASMKASLKTLSNLKEGRKIAVIGDMFELGDFSKSLHYELGEFIGNLKIDFLFIMGEYSNDILEGAINSGMPYQNIFIKNTHYDIFKGLKEIIKENDSILIKGSRGMKMENVLEELVKYEGVN